MCWIEAERTREFSVAEAGGDADVRIVAGDVVGAQQRAEEREEALRAAAAGGLTRENDSGGASKGGTERGEFCF